MLNELSLVSNHHQPNCPEDGDVTVKVIGLVALRDLLQTSNALRVGSWQRIRVWAAWAEAFLGQVEHHAKCHLLGCPGLQLDASLESATLDPRKLADAPASSVLCLDQQAKKRFANPMWVMENCAAIPVDAPLLVWH